MTVRTWFRLLRRSAWESELPDIYVYFRTPSDPKFGPLSSPLKLTTFTDYQAFIDQGEIPRPVRALITEMMERAQVLSMTSDAITH